MKHIYLEQWDCITATVLNLLSKWQGQTLNEVWLDWDEKQYKSGTALHWACHPIIFTIGKNIWAIDSGCGAFGFVQNTPNLTIQQMGEQLIHSGNNWQLNPIPRLAGVIGQRIEQVRLVKYNCEDYDTIWHGIELRTTGDIVTFCVDTGDCNEIELGEQNRQYTTAYSVDDLLLSLQTTGLPVTA